MNLKNLNILKELKILIFFFFEKFGNLEFFKGIENFELFFFFFEKFRNLEFFQGIENFEWRFFFFLKQPKKYKPNAFSPKALFEFFFFFFFLKNLEVLNFFMELKILIDFFFLKNLEILNFFKELKILNFFIFLKET